DPPPVGTTDLPPHGLSNLLGSLMLSFADLNSADCQQTWNEPIAPYGKPAAELVMTRDHGKKFWAFLCRHRDPHPEVFVIADEGGQDRRALSPALGVCDTLRLPRSAIVKPGDLDWQVGDKDTPANLHVHDIVKASRGLVVGQCVVSWGPAVPSRSWQ